MATSDIKLKEHKYKNYNFKSIFVIFIDVHTQNSFPNPAVNIIITHARSNAC